MMTGSAENTLVLGVGSPLQGDDAAGIAVIEQLQACADLPPGLDLVDGGTDGLGLIPLIEQYRRVIVVDAVLMGLPPGSIRRFTWQESRIHGSTGAVSLHQTGLNDALLLAEALNSLPPELVIYGIQPQNTGLEQPMSDVVERALPALAEALLNEVRSRD